MSEVRSNNLLFLYNNSCIEKWLLTCPKCPQCNAKSKRSDVRIIYSKSISVVDTRERDRALKNLKNEINIRISSQKAEAQAVLHYQFARVEYNRLRDELQLMKRKYELFSNNDDTSHDRLGMYNLSKSINISQVMIGTHPL